MHWRRGRFVKFFRVQFALVDDHICRCALPRVSVIFCGVELTIDLILAFLARWNITNVCKVYLNVFFKCFFGTVHVSDAAGTAQTVHSSSYDLVVWLTEGERIPRRRSLATVRSRLDASRQHSMVPTADAARCIGPVGRLGVVGGPENEIANGARQVRAVVDARPLCRERPGVWLDVGGAVFETRPLMHMTNWEAPMLNTRRAFTRFL